MRIKFERLRDAGYHVDVDDDGVTVYGELPMKFLDPVGTALRGIGIDDREADLLLDEFASKVERTLLFKLFD